MERDMICSVCRGTGKRTVWIAGKPIVYRETPCPDCAGSGNVDHDEDAARGGAEIRNRAHVREGPKKPE
jgi:DnaJ-class molecular chaperone